VLLLGESGTGKDPTAQAIHLLGKRNAKPWKKYNMRTSATDAGFHIATLFGRVDGKDFTVGLVEQTKEGTLFLDEIADATHKVQGDLLTFLDTGCYTPLGGIERHADTRIISATNKNPKQLLFDALPRLNKLDIRLPPLRERREDVGRLLFHFVRTRLEKLDRELEQAARAKSWLKLLDDPQPTGPWLSAELVCVLTQMPLNNNVRDLLNVAERLLVGLHDELLDARDLATYTNLIRALASTCADCSDSDEDSATDSSVEHTERPKQAGTSSSQPSWAATKQRRLLADVPDDELIQELKKLHYNEAALAAQLGVGRKALVNRLRLTKHKRFGDRTVNEVLTALKQLQPTEDEAGPSVNEICDQLRVYVKDLRGWLTQKAELLEGELRPQWVKYLHPNWISSVQRAR
jgi:two-component system nitrogen regulation response regulator GlnG